MPRKLLETKTKIKITFFIILAGGLISFSSAHATTQIYRSVGPGSTTALAEGTSNSFSIAGSTATFSSNLPTKIGVGDVIQYDSDGNDIVDALAFIYARTDAKNYTVKNVSGGTPTAVSNDTDWSIFRAYTSLSDAEAGTENTGLDSELRNFDTWTDGKNLVSADEQWNIACYGDAEDTTLGVVIRDWTTDSDNYLKIYTPYLSSEVGTSQRHTGSWTNSAYRLVISDEFPDGAPLSINTGSNDTSVNVWLDGLQIFSDSAGSVLPGIEIYNVSGETKISNSIIKTDPAITTTFGITIDSLANHGTYKVWNNIVYGFAEGGISLTDSNNTLYAYNNTVFGNGTSGSCYNRISGTFVAKNNIAQGCVAGFAGVFAESSEYNLSDLEDVAGSHSKNLTTLTFHDAVHENYHLDSSDTTANAGTNLSADSYLSFSTDIDNDSRADLWYIGADERTPDTTQTCIDFSYSAWGDCQSNNTQTREATGYPNNCAGEAPEALTQSCTYVPPTCTEFIYSAWGDCQPDGTQTRSLSSSSPANCVGETVLTQSCSYTAPQSSSSSHHKKKKKKKKSSSKYSIKTSPTKVSRGQVIIQSGKKFSKNSPVRVYFAGGSSKLIRTTAQGTFSIAFKIPYNKPAGSYPWFAIDLVKNKRSKNSIYKVR